jgi:transglutaminase-like putative cysteine protease
LAERPASRPPELLDQAPFGLEPGTPSSLLPVAPLLGAVPGEESATEPAPDVVSASPVDPVNLPLVVAQTLPSRPLTGIGNYPVTGLFPERAPTPALLPVQRRMAAAPPPVVPVDLRIAEPARPGPQPATGTPQRSMAVPALTVPLSSGSSPETATPLPTGARRAASPWPQSVLPPVQRLVSRSEPTRSWPSPGGAPTVTVQRAVEEPAATPAMPESPAEPPVPPVVPAGLPGAEGAVTAVAAGAAAGGALAAGDLDALAGRLYDKIRYRLKAELRLDRERAGLITDRR